jgi:hypothetical protein
MLELLACTSFLAGCACSCCTYHISCKQKATDCIPPSSYINLAASSRVPASR